MRTKTPIIPAVAALGLLLSGASQAALVAHYTLDETSGTTAGDSSGTGNNLAWQGTVGTPGWSAAGVAGTAISFTGLNLDAFYATSTIPAGIPLSISLWVKTTSTEKDGLVYVGDSSSNSIYYLAQIQSGVAKTVARNTLEIQSDGSAVNDDAWHHVVSVFNANNSREIWVDGTRIIDAVDDTVLVNPLTPNRIGIGALTRNTGVVDLFTGLMDDVQIYSNALSQSQIQFLQANPGATVPEPTAAMLLALGVGFGAFRRRRKA